MTERWMVIDDFPNYSVSDFGRVKRLTFRGRWKAGALIKSRPGRRNGTRWYGTVTLWRDSQRKEVFLHKLVAATFLGPCPKGMEPNHKNGDIDDNCVANLEYMTRAQNIQHAVDIGLKLPSLGERNGKARFTEQDVRNIRSKFHGEYGQCAALAQQYKCSHGAVRSIINGRTWRHIQ